MADLTAKSMAGKLLADGFPRSGPTADALSDPISDTPMVVTLDELRPYELDPRITRNPLYDVIKASIRKRGLDAPPPITRRPGADHYIIRNGGNTRLAILRDLWSETREDRFFRFQCLFRPWPERGEIIALTGHLAENELHGGLSFIERALGIEKARELYEQESTKPLSQSDLARRLTADGYPVQQSHISRMQDTVRYLLPAIPNVLYGGLGRHQIERLSVLRKACERIWMERSDSKRLGVDFSALFHDVLAAFDTQPDGFSTARIQDELVGQMSELLDADYNALVLDIDNIENRQRVVAAPPKEPPEPRNEPPALSPSDEVGSAPEPPRLESEDRRTRISPPAVPETNPATVEAPTPAPALPQPDHDTDERLRAHIVSPAPTTERLQSIQQLVAEHTGETLPDFADNVLRAIPVQAGGLFPISDVWYIEPGLDTPDRMRVHLAQFAREIAGEAQLADCIKPIDAGIGFVCSPPAQDLQSLPAFGRATLALLRALSASYFPDTPPLPGLDRYRLDDVVAPLLQGPGLQTSDAVGLLSDNGLVKLFRMLRLARRLLALEPALTGGGTTFDET